MKEKKVNWEKNTGMATVPHNLSNVSMGESSKGERKGKNKNFPI